MLAVVILSARRTVRRLALPPAPLLRLSVGLVALGLLVLGEFTMALWIRGLTISEYIANRDPVAGAVYVVMLLLFAAMPLIAARR
jgi:hypothetical protein